MTHREKIEAVVASMASWDYEELLAWAQDARRGMLSSVTREVVDEEYEEACGEAPAAAEARTVLLPDGREVAAERCACGDGSCASCDDDGWAPASDDVTCPVCDARNVHQHDPPHGWECHDCGAEWTRLPYPKLEGGTNR